MNYAHTFAPAWLLFELSRLIDYLVTTTHLMLAEVLSLISESKGMPLPATQESLVKDGLSPKPLLEKCKAGLNRVGCLF